jgi:hypothetical protein
MIVLVIFLFFPISPRCQCGAERALEEKALDIGTETQLITSCSGFVHDAL